MPTLPPLSYGKIVGRFVAIVGDDTDPDDLPDAVPLAGSVTFTPSVASILVANATPVPATVIPTQVTVDLDVDGYISLNGLQYLFLVATDDPSTNPTGFTYTVSFALTLDGQPVNFSSYSISVPTYNSGTDNVIDLTLVAPVSSSEGTLTIVGPIGPKGDPGPGVLGGGTTGQILAKASNADQDTVWVDPAGGTVLSVNGQSGAVTLTAADVGAATTAQGAKADTAVQPGALGSAAYVSTTTFATAAQGAKADTALQTAPVTSVAGRTGAIVLTKSDVSLSNVDNTADASKPVSTAQATAINAKYTKPGTGIPKTDLESAVQTSLGKADTALQAVPTQTLNAQTGTTYTVVLADPGKLVTLTNAAAITVTLPSNSTAIPVGGSVDFIVLGAGMVTFQGDGTSTVSGTPSLVSRAQYSAATAIKISTNGWVVVGDLA
jgi:hypothetical protein